MTLHRVRRRGGRARLARASSATRSSTAPTSRPDEPAAERDATTATSSWTTGCAQALARLNPDAARRGARGGAPQADRGPTRRQPRRAQPRASTGCWSTASTVEYRRTDGSIAGAQARVIDFDDPDNNDWLAVNQFTVVEGQHNRRPDVVLFVNGLPLAVIELKNAGRRERDRLDGVPPAPDLPGADPGAVRYQRGAGRLRRRAGADRHARRGQGVVQALADDRRARGSRRATLPELQVLLEGVFEQRRFLDLVRHFIVFEDAGGGKLAKKMAGYHQFHAVNEAVEETLRAAQSRSTTPGATTGHSRAASRATGASAWSGTRRARARA